MTLADLPLQKEVLVDANILIYAVSGTSDECRAFMHKINIDELPAVVPTLQMAETMHRLMIAESRDHGWISGKNPARSLAERPERIQSLRRYAESIRDLMVLKIRIEPVIAVDFDIALGLQRQYGVLTNDSLLLAVGQRLRIQNLATADRNLTRVDIFNIYQPADLS